MENSICVLNDEFLPCTYCYKPTKEKKTFIFKDSSSIELHGSYAMQSTWTETLKNIPCCRACVRNLRILKIGLVCNVLVLVFGPIFILFLQQQATLERVFSVSIGISFFTFYGLVVAMSILYNRDSAPNTVEKIDILNKKKNMLHFILLEYVLGSRLNLNNNYTITILAFPFSITILLLFLPGTALVGLATLLSHLVLLFVFLAFMRLINVRLRYKIFEVWFPYTSPERQNAINFLHNHSHNNNKSIRKKVIKILKAIRYAREDVE